MSAEQGGRQESLPFKDANNWFSVVQISENIWGIREPNHEEDVVSYFMRGNQASVLIDSGMGLSDIQQVIPERDPQVLLTHSHWDHTGGAWQFPSVAIFNNDFETSNLSSGWNSSEVGYSTDSFVGRIPPDFLPEAFQVSGKEDFATLEDDQIIDLGDISLRVIHTPGHTPGSVCFFIEELGILITGDTLYPGPEYLHMTESNVGDYFASLRKLVEQTPGLRLILPGHNAIAAGPGLLLGHLEAAEGKMPPVSTKEGEDRFGPYVQKYWNDFSFILPRGK